MFPPWLPPVTPGLPPLPATDSNSFLPRWCTGSISSGRGPSAASAPLLPGGCRAPGVMQARPEGPAAYAPVVNASVRTPVTVTLFPLMSLSQHVQGAHRSQGRVHMYRRIVTAERSWPVVSFSFLGNCGHSHCLVRAGSRSPEQRAPNPALPLPQPPWAACLHTAAFLSA